MSKGQRPAFPNHPDNPEWRLGITIRDYFAAQAMQGLISNKLVMQTVADEFVTEGSKAIGRIAYQFADIMLEQREL